MKAAALEMLVKNNFLRSRRDAISRFLEAQLVILRDHVEVFLATIAESDHDSVAEHMRSILKDRFIHQQYPRVTLAFAMTVYQALGTRMLYSIASAFVTNFDLRAGWPDLTVVGPDGVQFVEVKTNDKLHESQLRFAEWIGNPLNLNCSVVQLRVGVHP